MATIASFAVFEDKLNKALKKFTKLEAMTAEQIKSEFWDIQAQFDRMTEEQYETFDSQVLLARQKALNEKHNELAGFALC